MVTSIHARPQGRNVTRSLKGSIIVVCPRCSSALGVVIASHQMQPILNAHRCKSAVRDKAPSSVTVPFS